MCLHYFFFIKIHKPLKNRYILIIANMWVIKDNSLLIVYTVLGNTFHCPVCVWAGLHPVCILYQLPFIFEHWPELTMTILSTFYLIFKEETAQYPVIQPSSKPLHQEFWPLVFPFLYWRGPGHFYTHASLWLYWNEMNVYQFNCHLSYRFTAVHCSDDGSVASRAIRVVSSTF